MIYIGTSGYHYEHWKTVFYPNNLKEKEWLEFYATFFQTVELNVSFYRLPSEKAFNFWYNSTPSNFVFSVKGSRYITHNKKLLNTKDSVEIFMNRALLLKEKLGIVLWQFPSNFGLNLERLEEFLLVLSQYGAKNAFEFRNKEWFDPEVYKLLEKYNVALVIADSPFYPSSDVLTADFAYVRFHGGKVLYGSEYTKKELKQWSENIKKWSKMDSYIYFNNDVFGFAVKNAKELLTLLDS